MGKPKSKRSRQVNRLKAAMDPERNTQSPAETPFLIVGSNWEAANTSDRRGFLLWHPSADPRREMRPVDDLEIRRKTHWLYENDPISRRILRGQAQLIGIQSPQPVTDDDDWNEAAWEYFNATAGSQEIFDARGRHDFYSAQVQINIEAAKDGRLIGVLTESPAGHARQAFYGAHQIRSNREQDAAGWEQGLRLDKFDRHLAYSLCDAKDANLTFAVSARDAVYYANEGNMAALHGQPLLSTVIHHLHDLVEINASTKMAIKKTDELGIVVETESGPGIMMPNGQLLGVPTVRTVETVEEVTDGDGKPIGTEVKQRKVTWDEVTGPTGIADLKPGQKVKLVQSDNPGPNREAWQRRLVDYIVLATDWEAEALHYVSDLKGPGVRYCMQKIQRQVMLTHRRQAPKWNRHYVYAIAKGIKLGQVPPPPPFWWRHTLWIGMPDPTIDAGREGAATVTQLSSGLTTWGDEWAKKGKFGWTKVKERIWEFARAKREAIAAGEFYKLPEPLELGEIITSGRGAA
jgi:capsid protein